MDIGQVRSDVQALADLEQAITHLRAALADGATDGDPGEIPDGS